MTDLDNDDDFETDIDINDGGQITPWRVGLRLNQSAEPGRRTERRAVTNRTFTTPEFIGGPVTDG